MNQSEIEDSDHSSDEDYSPGSLVIDTAGFGGGVWMCVCVDVCVHEHLSGCMGFRKISHSLNFFSHYDGENECRGYTIFSILLRWGGTLSNFHCAGRL